MKTIKLNFHLILLPLLVFFFVATTSCTKEEDSIIPAKTTEQRRQELLQFATSEKAMVESAVIGYDKRNFMVASTSKFAGFKTAYLKVLDAALVIANKPEVTVLEITKAYISFGVPGQAFQNSLFISDRRPLNDLIVQCETLNVATVGTGSGQVSQEAKTAFSSAITAAKKSRDLLTTIDRQVTDGVTALGNAKKTFEGALIK